MHCRNSNGPRRRGGGGGLIRTGNTVNYLRVVNVTISFTRTVISSLIYANGELMMYPWRGAFKAASLRATSVPLAKNRNTQEPFGRKECSEKLFLQIANCQLLPRQGRGLGVYLLHHSCQLPVGTSLANALGTLSPPLFLTYVSRNIITFHYLPAPLQSPLPPEQ